MSKLVYIHILLVVFIDSFLFFQLQILDIAPLNIKCFVCLSWILQNINKTK